MPDTPKNLSRTGGLLILGLMFATIAGLSYFAFRAVDQRQSVDNRDDKDTVATVDEDEQSDVGSVLDSLIDNGDSSDDSVTDDGSTDGTDSDAEGDTTSDITKDQDAVLPSAGPDARMYLLIAAVSIAAAAVRRLQFARRP